MQFIRDKLNYEEVKYRFEKEGYTLLSSEYKNAKSSLNVQCPQGHEWVTNISNFDFGRRCSLCSKKKKYTYEEVKGIFAMEGYQVLDLYYISNKTSMKINCSNGHELEMKLNYFINGRRCILCKRLKAIEERRKKLLMVQKKHEFASRHDEINTFGDKIKKVNSLLEKPEVLEQLDEMRKNLKFGKRRTYRE